MSLPENILNPLLKEGFAFVPRDAMRGLLAPHGALVNWDMFADSWNDLKTDTYMADRGSYRKRRYAVYTAAGGAIARRQQTKAFLHQRRGQESFGDSNHLIGC